VTELIRRGLSDSPHVNSHESGSLNRYSDSFERKLNNMNSCIRHRHDMVFRETWFSLRSSDSSAISASVFIISLYEVIPLTLSQQKSTAQWKFEECTKYVNWLRVTASHRSRTAPWADLFTKNIIFTDSEITAADSRRQPYSRCPTLHRTISKTWVSRIYCPSSVFLAKKYPFASRYIFTLVLQMGWSHGALIRAYQNYYSLKGW